MGIEQGGTAIKEMGEEGGRIERQGGKDKQEEAVVLLLYMKGATERLQIA